LSDRSLSILHPEASGKSALGESSPSGSRHGTRGDADVVVSLLQEIAGLRGGGRSRRGDGPERRAGTSAIATAAALAETPSGESRRAMDRSCRNESWRPLFRSSVPSVMYVVRWRCDHTDASHHAPVLMLQNMAVKHEIADLSERDAHPDRLGLAGATLEVCERAVAL
jgi:hypothetical protein